MCFFEAILKISKILSEKSQNWTHFLRPKGALYSGSPISNRLGLGVCVTVCLSVCLCIKNVKKCVENWHRLHMQISTHFFKGSKNGPEIFEPLWRCAPKGYGAVRLRGHAHIFVIRTPTFSNERRGRGLEVENSLK